MVPFYTELSKLDSSSHSVGQSKQFFISELDSQVLEQFHKLQLAS